MHNNIGSKPIFSMKATIISVALFAAAIIAFLVVGLK